MTKDKILLGLAFFLLWGSGGIYFYYGYLYKASRNIGSEESAYKIAAVQLLAEYNSNQQKANSLYLNKTIEVTGKVTKVSDSIVMVDTGVFCLSSVNVNKDLEGQKIVIKGKCIGYDELFQEVKLDQCKINK